MPFETIPCPSCGSREYRPALEVTDRFETVPNSLFVIVRCSTCRLLFLNPRPDAVSIGAFYEAGSYDPFLSSQDRRSLSTAAYRLARRFTIRRKAERVVRGLTGGKSLDVGCATGEFVAEFRRRSFDAMGVEPDARASDYACRQGLAVRTGGIEQVSVEEGPFALITLWHVLEHVHDLEGTLRQARDLLDRRGRLAVAVPNPASWDARVYGARWVAWDAPRHLYHFEPTVMLDVLTRAGFTAERKGAVALDAFYHCLLSERRSPMGYLRGGALGLVSCVLGLLGRNGSSELYMARRT